MKRIAGALVGLFGLLLAILVVRAWLAGAPTGADVSTVRIELDEDAIANRLGEAIRIRTISPQAPDRPDPATFADFAAWLQETYPRVHSLLERKTLDGGSLLYTWIGRDPDLAPILLTAHFDVVPVVPGSESDWRHPPFSGVVEDGYVWGRGALDDKSGVIAMLEAVDFLAAQGFAPDRTVYFAFGHDEEIGGVEGAGRITEYLRGRNVELAWSLDEGSFLISGLYPGIEVPVASINVAEKGYLTLDLVAKGEGGHSSMPPTETAVGRLAAALVRLEENPIPGGIDEATGQSLDSLAVHMPFSARLIFANRWLFAPVIEVLLGNVGPVNALLRTTTAPTMLRGSVKENVLPTEAVATVNFRLHPRDTKASVIAHVTQVVDDPEIEIRVRREGMPASKVARSSSEGFAAIAAATREIYGPIAVVPGVTVGGTDSRHYGQIARDAYRFNPMVVTGEDISGFHGTNERIAVSNLAQGTRVYIQLLRRAAASSKAGD